MRVCIITGGPGISPKASGLAAECDSVICADSGADYALSNGIVPDAVYGDLDSVTEIVRERLEDNNIPIEKYPTHKDKTDTEIAIDSVPEEAEILLLCSLTGRIDHVMANLQIALRRHKEGRHITLTDGITDIIPLTGPETVTVEGLTDPAMLAVSLMPADIGSPVKGVTTSGLEYSLEDAEIIGGSSLTVSNCVEADSDRIEVRIDSGDMYLVITDKHL